jgi:putative protease
MMTDRIRTSILPELLAPAGSPEALEAAFRAGADAVYLGGSRFNARMNAHNFDDVALREAVSHAHRLGGRVYLTLNTLVWDRELPEVLDAAYEAASAGVDALIVADVGAAALIRRALPNLPLHASTQLSGHNASVGGVLAPFGFSRFVIARETSLADLAAAVRNNPIEVEVFIHGALCVSHSGQCLFSSVVGGRSGNRGECAQPCRLPYSCADCRSAGKNAPSKGDRRPPRPERPGAENYPLSLKDLSLAAHVPALLDAGVSSLKIEGRMKSPGYVGGVTAIWRRLLDERRAATPEEMAALGDLFSRGGFTDGYQTGKITRSMMGIRSDSDKERTAAAEKAATAAKYLPHLPVSMTLTARRGDPVTLTAEAPLYRQGCAETVSVTVAGEPMGADELAPLSDEAVEKQLTRTGGTAYRAESIRVQADEALRVPLSRLNALRREALERLDEARLAAMPDPAAGYIPVSVSDVAAEMGQPDGGNA